MESTNSNQNLFEKYSSPLNIPSTSISKSSDKSKPPQIATRRSTRSIIKPSSKQHEYIWNEDLMDAHLSQI
jgi:hypothetical protein